MKLAYLSLILLAIMPLAFATEVDFADCKVTPRLLKNHLVEPETTSFLATYPLSSTKGLVFNSSFKVTPSGKKKALNISVTISSEAVMVKSGQKSSKFSPLSTAPGSFTTPGHPYFSGFDVSCAKKDPSELMGKVRETVLKTLSFVNCNEVLVAEDETAAFADIPVEKGVDATGSYVISRARPQELATPEKLSYTVTEELLWLKGKTPTTDRFTGEKLETAYREFLNTYGLADYSERRLRFSQSAERPFSVIEMTFLNYLAEKSLRVSVVGEDAPKAQARKVKVDLVPVVNPNESSAPVAKVRRIHASSGKPSYVSARSWIIDDIATVLQKEGFEFRDVVKFYQIQGFRNLKTNKSLSSSDIESQYRQYQSQSYTELTEQDLEELRGFSNVAKKTRVQTLQELIKKGYDLAAFHAELIASGFSDEELSRARNATDPAYKEAHIEAQVFKNLVAEKSKTMESSLALLTAQRDRGHITEEDFEKNFEAEKQAIERFLLEAKQGTKAAAAGISNTIINKINNLFTGDSTPFDAKEQFAREALGDALRDHGSVITYNKHLDEIEKKYMYRPLARPLEASTNLVKGAGVALAGLVQAKDVLREMAPMNALDAFNYLRGKEFKATDGDLYKLGESIKYYVEEMTPRNPDFKGEFMVEALPQIVGHFTVTFATGVVTGGSTIAVLGVGGAIGGTSQYQEAVKFNATADQRKIATLVGSLVGMTDAIPIGKYLKPLTGVQKLTFLERYIETIFTSLSKKLNKDSALLVTKAIFAKQMYQAVYSEGLQELSEKKINDLAAKLTYDEKRQVLYLQDADLNEFMGGMFAGRIGGAFQIATTIANTPQSLSIKAEIKKQVEALVQAQEAAKPSQLARPAPTTDWNVGWKIPALKSEKDQVRKEIRATKISDTDGPGSQLIQQFLSDDMKALSLFEMKALLADSAVIQRVVPDKALAMKMENHLAIDLVENLLGRRITLKQKDAVVRAHHEGNGNPQKMKSLLASQFTPQQVTEIYQEGYNSHRSIPVSPIAGLDANVGWEVPALKSEKDALAKSIKMQDLTGRSRDMALLVKQFLSDDMKALSKFELSAVVEDPALIGQFIPDATMARRVENNLRIAWAEAFLGRRITLNQKRAVVDAHHKALREPQKAVEMLGPHFTVEQLATLRSAWANSMSPVGTVEDLMSIRESVSAAGDSQTQQSRTLEFLDWYIAKLKLGKTNPPENEIEGYNALTYYVDKISEIKSLDRSAPLATSLRLLIMATTYKKESIVVPLKSLFEIHPISRGAAIEKLNDRITSLRKIPIPAGKISLTSDLINEFMPSKNLIRVIQADNGEYVVFDGNGRLVAMREVFGMHPDVEVEVEIYRSNSWLMQRNLRALRNVRHDIQGQE
ncbi:MAG TPA: hypothetical protein VNJ01_02530 [Bacteriovoracaceae bacterium]|nr:hypothetical protein [Bacteriovoracaceae bacterium]